MSGPRESDRCAWRNNYDNKSLSGIEVLANDGQIVNFITIHHKEVLKDKEAHRTIIRLDENSKPILPAKKTFEELIQAKRRQQAILFGHSTPATNTTNHSVLSNRAARRAVAAATNAVSSKNRQRSTAPSTGTSLSTAPSTTTSLIPPEEVDHLAVARASRPKRRRWPKLSRTRRSASTKKRIRDRALKAARDESIDEANDDSNENSANDNHGSATQDATCASSPDEHSSPVPGTSGINQKPTKQQSAAIIKKKTSPELENDLDDSTASTNDEVPESDIASPRKDRGNIDNASPSERPNTTSGSRSPSKSMSPKRNRPRPSKSKSKKKKKSPSVSEGKKVVTSIKALCKQNSSLADVDPKEVKMLLKSAEPGTSIVLPNGTVIKKSRRGGARAGAGRKRTKPTPGSPADSMTQARSPNHTPSDHKQQQDLVQTPTKQQQTPPSSPRCGSTTSSPAGRKSISRSSKKSDTSKDSIKK